MIYRIALAQVNSLPLSPERNLARVRELAADSAAMEADLLLLPEAFLTGYEFPLHPTSVLSPDSPVFAELAEIARENHLAIVATAFVAGEKTPRNSALVFDKQGQLVLRYDKVHTCDFSEEANLESGEAFYSAEVDGVRLGVMICYDREYPESARLLMLQGAEIILVPNDCGQMPARLRALATRAYENMVGVAMANPPGPGKGCSCAYSPIVWDRDENDLDPTICLAGELESGLFLADFDLDLLRAYREREMMGNTFRKVSAYTALLDGTVDPPFFRSGQQPGREEQ